MTKIINYGYSSHFISDPGDASLHWITNVSLTNEIFNTEIILIQANADKGSAIQKALESIGSSNSVRVFNDVTQYLSFFREALPQNPQFLFMNFCDRGRICIKAISSIRKNRKIRQMSIAVYDSNTLASDEETFWQEGIFISNKKLTALNLREN